ncbi:MAG: hypothetical protein RLZZ214_1786 [Verrucomicrobiota bacterium]|jgi:hypothetical protein
MNAKFTFICLFSSLAAVLSSGCLVREKVTVNGEVMEEGYKVKRPLKDAIDNSQ